MLIKTGGPVQQTEQQTAAPDINIKIVEPPKDWAMELIVGILIAVAAGTIIRWWTHKK